MKDSDRSGRKPYTLPIDVVVGGELMHAGDEANLFPDQIKRIKDVAKSRHAHWDSCLSELGFGDATKREQKRSMDWMLIQMHLLLSEEKPLPEPFRSALCQTLLNIAHGHDPSQCFGPIVGPRKPPGEKGTRKRDWLIARQVVYVKHQFGNSRGDLNKAFDRVTELHHVVRRVVEAAYYSNQKTAEALWNSKERFPHFASAPYLQPDEIPKTN